MTYFDLATKDFTWPKATCTFWNKEDLPLYANDYGGAIRTILKIKDEYTLKLKRTMSLM